MDKIGNFIATVLAVSTLFAIYWFGIEWHKWKAVWDVLTYKNLIVISGCMVIILIFTVFLKAFFVSMRKNNVSSNFGKELVEMTVPIIIYCPIVFLISRGLHDLAVHEFFKFSIGTRGFTPEDGVNFVSSIFFLTGVGLFIFFLIKAILLKHLDNNG